MTQPDLWGNVADPFEAPLLAVAHAPDTTVIDCDLTERNGRRLRALIGDAGTARANCLQPDDPGGRRVYKAQASVFNPTVAAQLLTLCAPPPGGTVYDPFAGGGTRAIVAAKLGYRYVGVELRPEESEAITIRAKGAGCSDRVAIYTGDARKGGELIRGEIGDALITCPPYWNLERYDGPPGDLSGMDYPAFVDGLHAVVADTARVLHPGALAAWVIGLHRHPDGSLATLHHAVAGAHAAAGFTFLEEVVLAQRNNGAVQRVGMFDRGRRYLVRNHEYALVFRNARR